MTDPQILFNAIVEKIKTYLPDQDPKIFEKAYLYSVEAHKTQQRAGGEPYIVHPLHVAQTLCDLQMDIPTLSAALLHDVLEDTSVNRETLMREFGKEITSLVEGVTKIDSLEQLAINPENANFISSTPELVKQAEYWRKMLVASAEDIRVIILKLADRKHNMETLEFLHPEKRIRIAEETISLYAPLAQRLGMYKLKSTLEDLSLKYLEPGIYQTLEKKMHELKLTKEEFLIACVEKIKMVLFNSSIHYRISARPKNIYSIYRKMLRQNKPFEEIQDIAGIRLITDSVEHCYAVLGTIHSNFTPAENTFTDYIATPKMNLYQSLHTTVFITPKDLIEIQIRTEEMHDACEYGIAAHWRYKQGASKSKNLIPQQDAIESKLDWIKHILEWQQDTGNPEEFLEGLKIELAFDQVFVFTPKGEVKKLPLGSTPIDFAFSVHTDLGHQCIGAKVNGKMMKLDTPLKSGDQCEILIRKGQKPHKDWLEFVKTPRARSKIRKYFREHPER